MTNARIAALTVAFLVCSPVAGVALAGSAGAAASGPALGSGPALDSSPETAVPAVGDDPNATVDHEGENLTLATETGQTVSGTTTLSEGTQVAITVRGTGSSPFLRRTQATVGPDGAFSATMDFSELDAAAVGTPTLTVHRGTDQLASIEVEFTPGPGPEPDPRTDDGNDGDDDDRSDPGTDGGDRAGNDDASVEFSAHVVQTYRGDTVAVPVQVGDAGEAVLRIGDEEVDYVLTVHVEDGDGDGAVTVVFDTGHASNESRVAAAKSDADAVTVTNVAGEAAPLNQDGVTLPAEKYPMTLSRSDDDGNEVAVGTLVITGSDDGGDSDGSGHDGAGGDDSNADGGDGSNVGGTDRVSGDQSGGLPAEPSTIGLAVVAVVALGVAGGLTLFRR